MALKSRRLASNRQQLVVRRRQHGAGQARRSKSVPTNRRRLAQNGRQVTAGFSFCAQIRDRLPDGPGAFRFDSHPPASLHRAGVSRRIDPGWGWGVGGGPGECWLSVDVSQGTYPQVWTDAVDECLSLSVDTVVTYPWAGQGGAGQGPF